MQLDDHAKEWDEATLPPKIYAALVDSMCQNFWPMLSGAICAGIAALLTALKTGDVWIWPCALLIIAVGTLRALQTRNYLNSGTATDAASAKRWETQYRFGAILYALSLGLWCVVVILGTDDPVAHMLCTTVTVGYTAGGAARNYGRPHIVQLHLLLSCGPMSLALVLHGGAYYYGLAALLVLFFYGLRSINLNLHAIFVNALLAGEREAALANQFDTALNNMPHGLCMFGGKDGRLAVMNRRFARMMRLPDDFMHRSGSAADIVKACVGAGTISPASGRLIVSEIDNALAGEIITVDSETTDAHAFSWTFQPMTGGGTVVLVEDITERRSTEARIIHLARYDELTALPNRVNFRDEIERLLTIAQNRGETQPAALLFIDLDQFKQVNDTLGHPCGDRLLCDVANRLREMLRPEDYIARFGGDEFVVFQQHLKSDEDAAVLARRIVDRLSERYVIDHHVVEIGASIGIAMTAPGIKADVLLKNADMALYRAKADGRGTYCFFRDEMAQTVEARRMLELDLRRALANDEFELFFQPLVNLKTGRISTCEALLRWNHPVRGTVSPVDIIPVAEEMGLIIDLGRWILRKACTECMQWPEAVSVAVNFSSQQFHQRDVMDEVRYALQASGLAPQRLEIEITESSLLRNTQWTLDALHQLHAEGVRIALDDFGTGYSSLSYLHTFPLQKVKIDRSFLEGIDTDRPLTLLRGVARLSADLGMSVVVEGIETNEQLELISADGTVTEAQGYLFSRPVPASRVRELLVASHGRHAGETRVVAPPARITA
uniref:Diguanylate cyclase/phosphodiesterase n=1 Tax=Rhodopseudomonas palustris (strain BisA53) TaxID=316055 RepID=Q07HF9_RHOP5